MEEAVDSADVDEGAVVGEAADGAGERRAFGDLVVATLFGGAVFFFGDGTAVYDDVFFGCVELDDAAANLLADELLDLGSVARSTAGVGHEGANAYVHAEATFDDGRDRAGDDGLVGEGLFERGPVFWLRDTQAGELVVALFVAALDGDHEPGAWFDGLVCALEQGERENALCLVADIDEDLLGGDGDDGSGDLAAVVRGSARVGLLVLLKDLVEGFGGLG